VVETVCTNDLHHENGIRQSIRICWDGYRPSIQGYRVENDVLRVLFGCEFSCD